MFQPSQFRAAQILLLGSLAIVSVACSNDNPTASPSSNAGQAAPTATASAKPTVSPAKQLKDDSSGQKSYEQAQNKALSAASISQSAQSPQDWQLVESKWHEAIALLKQVPASSPKHAQAKSQIAQYQRNLAYAKKRVASPSSESVVFSGPNVFQAPIRGRIGGTPAIDVIFNGKHTFKMIVDTGASGTVITNYMATKLGVVADGFAIADTPSAKGVQFAVGKVKSIAVGGAQVNNVPVVIAPQLDFGLLGQDFFSRYDVTIKQDVVEFRAR